MNKYRLLMTQALLVGLLCAGALSTRASVAIETVHGFQTLPGAPVHSPELSAKLQKIVKAKGTSYRPRTQYKINAHTPKYTNRLVLETSTYLQQHAHNPVNWYPWGEEAFEAARIRGIPVLLSIGYSTCHWCHVMEEESYDDEETARYINEHFIAIKVDREVRPDVDQIYMTALHAMGQRGGWPLNMWLTPSREPFYGGTYFAPTEKYGRPSFKRVLSMISDEYAKDPKGIAQHAQALTQRVKQSIEGDGQAVADAVVSIDALTAMKNHYFSQFDPEWGGIKGAPKFPSSMSVNALIHQLKYAQGRGEEPKQSQQTLEMIELTLHKMALGGMYDQVGGGFHRYSTDKKWLIPHFEKMLYDNALLASVYVSAWQLTGKPFYQKIAKQTLDYVLREMTSPNGGFYSATDADSIGPHGEMEEGYYFSWTPDELNSVLNKGDAELAQLVFGINQKGNFEGRSLPQRWSVIPGYMESKVEGIKRQLYLERQTRPSPLRDEKQLSSWNGLMISAFSKAGFAFNEPKYLAAAEKSARRIRQKMFVNGRLKRVSQQGQVSDSAFLEDYAYIITGVLDLYEANHNIEWLNFAVELQAVLQKHYADSEGGGYYRTSNDHEKLLAREKNLRDGAIPSGNSYAVLNLLRLYQFTLDESYQKFAVLSLKGVSTILETSPTQLPEMLIALDYYHSRVKEVVIVKPKLTTKESEVEFNALLSVLRQSWVPNKILVVVGEAEIKQQQSRVPVLQYKKALKGQVTAYVCYEQQCELPTSIPSVLAEQLGVSSSIEY